MEVIAILVLLTYDIDMTDKSAGGRRLRLISKKCESIGRRVQDSVFECWLDAKQLRDLQSELKEMIDPQHDSLRFYNLGNRYANRIEVFGTAEVFQPDQPLIL